MGRYDGRVSEPAGGSALDRSALDGGAPGLDLGLASPDDDTPKEACGVFGVFAPGQPVSHLTYLGLYALQHRGQESAGMAVSDGQSVTVVKDMGLVSNVFDDRTLAALTGHLAIGHTRYSTTGSSNWRNAQPVYRDVAAHTVALAHNGNLVNTEELAEEPACCPGTVTSRQRRRGRADRQRAGQVPRDQRRRPGPRAGAARRAAPPQGRLLGGAHGREPRHRRARPQRLPPAVPRQARPRLGARLGEPGARRRRRPHRP